MIQHAVRSEFAPPDRIQRPWRTRERPAVTFALHRLVAEDDKAWAWLPHVVGRVERFCTRYNSDQSPLALRAFITSGFVARSDRLGLWGYFADDRLIGHVLASIEESPDPLRLGGTLLWAFVSQVESDLPAPRAAIAEGFAVVEAWARSRRAAFIELATDVDPRLWRRLGFRVHRTIMRRMLDNGTEPRLADQHHK